MDKLSFQDQMKVKQEIATYQTAALMRISDTSIAPMVRKLCIDTIYEMLARVDPSVTRGDVEIWVKTKEQINSLSKL